MKNFNEVFRKNVAFDDIKSHKKVGIHALSRKYIFGKTIGSEIKLIPLPLNLFRVKMKKNVGIRLRAIKFIKETEQTPSMFKVNKEYQRHSQDPRKTYNMESFAAIALYLRRLRDPDFSSKSIRLTSTDLVLVL